MWHGEEGTREHRTQRWATPARCNPALSPASWLGVLDTSRRQIPAQTNQPGPGREAEEICIAAACTCMRCFITWKDPQATWSAPSRSEMAMICWDWMGHQLTFQRSHHLGHFTAEQRASQTLSPAKLISLPFTHGLCATIQRPAKKTTFYSFSEPAIPEKEETLNCFAHTPKSVQGQIQRELKSGENFLSVFQPRNDQKVHQRAPKQPGVAGKTTRGWGCGAFGEYPATIWK